MAPKAEWAVLAAALVAAVPIWRTATRGASAGDVVEAPITLVPEDRGRLACLLDHPVGRYSCAYRSERDEWKPRPAPENVAVPCLTTDRTLFLVPGLFENSAIADHLRASRSGARFTARCKLRLVELVPDFELRFGADAPWGREGPAWLAEPLACVVE